LIALLTKAEKMIKQESKEEGNKLKRAGDIVFYSLVFQAFTMAVSYSLPDSQSKIVESCLQDTKNKLEIK